MHLPPSDDDTWVGVVDCDLPVARAEQWASTPDCGARVTFTGLVRDHSDGRPGVTRLTYESYRGPAERRLAEIVAEARVRWPALGRVALLHRTGDLAVGEPTVVVVVASPHRAEAFEAAQFCIDQAKASAPIWKHEVWAGGAGWVGGSTLLTVATAVAVPAGSVAS